MQPRCREALREAITEMVKLGGREARKGRFYSGDALDWCRLDFTARKRAMEASLRGALADWPGARREGADIFVRIDGREVLVRPHAIPAPMSVASAREMVGQPFLHDHECASLLTGKRAGPVHVIACHRSATESQVLKQLGFADATVVSAPFGIYVADDIQKIQIVFLANCRDESAAQHAMQRLYAWLAQSGEDARLSSRAAARTRIIRVIADVASSPRAGTGSK
jgi:hypothetical protein